MDGGAKASIAPPVCDGAGDAPSTPVGVTRARRAAAALTACLVIAVSAASPGAAVPVSGAALPRVINGTPGHPFAAAAVALETPDYYCTAALVAPRLLLTAAHCINGEGAGAKGVPPRDITVFPPGADRRSGAAKVAVIEIVYNPQWSESVDDIAYLVLDQALGTPIVSRLATPAEVAELSAARAVVTYVGYGLTGPRNVDESQVSDAPLAVSQPLTTGYRGGRGVFQTRGDGRSGTCAGDSGGPWLVQRGSELLLVGPLAGGSGLPCDEPESPADTGEEGTVAAAHDELLQRALARAGAAAGATTTPTAPTTPPGPTGDPVGAVSRVCLRGPDVKRTCTEGAEWTYRYCWNGPRAVLERFSASGWTTVARVRGERNPDCNRRFPFEVVFQQSALAPGAERYRVVIRGTSDPFTVTAT